MVAQDAGCGELGRQLSVPDQGSRTPVMAEAAVFPFVKRALSLVFVFVGLEFALAWLRLAQLSSKLPTRMVLRKPCYTIPGL